MSASDFDERKVRIDVSRFAPPRHRRPDRGATIAPVLERLSRGASEDDPDSTRAQSVPPVEPIHIHDAPSSLKIPLSMTGRLAAAMGLFAVLTVVSVTFLESKAERPASAVAPGTPEMSGASDMPKTVHTVSLRPDAAAVAEPQSAAAAQAAPSSPSSPPPAIGRGAPAATSSARPMAEPALALTAPLKAWAMFPDDPSARAWAPVAEPAKVKDANGGKDAAPKRAAVRRHKAKATRHARRKRHVKRRPVRAAAATAEQAPQTAPPAQAQANAAQPVKKLPLQAALDSIFGGPDEGASGNTAPAATGAATTGAAFQ